MRYQGPEQRSPESDVIDDGLQHVMGNEPRVNNDANR